MYPEEAESVAVEHLTEEFFTGAIRAIFDARRIAHDMCVERFEPPEAENLQPLIVRAKVNEYLRGVADRIPGCAASNKRSKGSSIKRVELRTGPISLTAHTVPEPCGRVKKYHYRRSLAKGNQASLFPEHDSPVGDSLYVLLLHSPYKRRTLKEQDTYDYLPGSIYLAFPTAGLSDYVHQVNLVDRYQALVDSLLPNDWDEDAKVVYRQQARAALRLAS